VRVTVVQMRVVFGDPSDNDAWGPNLQGRLLYKDTLYQMFCQSVEFADMIQPNQKVRTTGLLFGPSGTGKSEAARALASKLSTLSHTDKHT
jgi:transcriptional regulator with AAA-type ATPase domain